MYHTLKTQMQVATRRAAQIARQQRAAEWRSRLDAASYSCHREGASWIAEGPAGQRFDFSKTDTGDVLCLSHSGGIYLLTVSDGERACDCKSAAANGGTCKHTIAFSSVLMAHKMERADLRAQLREEGAEMQKLAPVNVTVEREDRNWNVVVDGEYWGQYRTQRDAELHAAGLRQAMKRCPACGAAHLAERCLCGGSELGRLRAEGQDRERMARAEWAVASGAGL